MHSRKFQTQDLADKASHLGELIDEAAAGLLPWQTVCDEIAGAFPGSMASIHANDLSVRNVNFLVASNIDQLYLGSYLRHYAFINPWNEHWTKAPAGRVSATEQDSPSRMFAGTEFYNDWLKPQKDLEAAAGIKIDSNNGIIVHLPIHYPLKLAGKYDTEVSFVLRRLRGNLQRAALIANRSATAHHRNNIGAALLERGQDAAVVVDRNFRIWEANGPATAHFRSGLVLQSIRGKLQLRNADMFDMLGHAVKGLLSNDPSAASRLHFTDHKALWRITLARLPGFANIAALTTVPSLVLVLLEQKSAIEPSADDLERLRSHFRLTAAELKLCHHLMSGSSLPECAIKLGIGHETARFHLKNIFYKTGSHRQSELVPLLLNVAR